MTKEGTSTPIPLLDSAAEALKDKEGVFLMEFTENGFKELMDGVIKEVLSSHTKYKLEVTNLEVHIKNKQGTVTAFVNTTSPSGRVANVEIEIVLENGKLPNTLRRVSSSVKRKTGGFFAMRPMLIIDKKMNETLRSPNKAFMKALNDQLKVRGVELQDVKLEFKDNSLSVELHSKNPEAAAKKYLADRGRKILFEAIMKFGKRAGEMLRSVGNRYNSLPRGLKYSMSGVLIITSLMVGTGGLIVVPAILRGIIAGSGVFVGVEMALRASREKEKRWFNAYPTLYAAALGIATSLPAFGKFAQFLESVPDALPESPASPPTPIDVSDNTPPEAPSIAHENVIAASTTASSGDGYERMLQNLKEELRERYPDSSKASPEIQHILATHVHKLAIEQGFYNSETGVSKIVAIGATFSVDEQGNFKYLAPDAPNDILVPPEESDTLPDGGTENVSQESLRALSERDQTVLLNNWQHHYPGTVPPEVLGHAPIPADGARYSMNWERTGDITGNIREAAAISPLTGHSVAKYILENGISARTIAGLSEAAQYLSPDGSLVAEIASHPERPAMYLLQDGRYAIFGGEHGEQLAVAKEAADSFGYEVALLPESGSGYEIVKANGVVSPVGGGLFGLGIHTLDATSAVLKIPL